MYLLDNYKIQKKIFCVFCLFVTAFSFLYAIVPMLALRENYCFTIWDELDQYASFAKIFKDYKLYFNRNQPLPVMGGINGILLAYSYNLHDFACCVLGYIPGQILTRIVCVTCGFFFMQLLLKRFAKNTDAVENCFIYLLSIAYAITPSATNREIAFGTLPGVVLLFLHFSEQNKVSKLLPLAFMIPFFSSFNAFLVFEGGFWLVLTILVCIKNRRININLIAAFVLICLGALLFYPDMFYIALHAHETNRGLPLQKLYSRSFKELFDIYFKDSQAHAPSYHKYFLMPAIFCGVIFSAGYYYSKKEQMSKDSKNALFLLCLMFGYTLFSSFIISLRESGFVTGFLLIDGFDFGRLLTFNRFAWYIMFAAVFFLLPEGKRLSVVGCFVLMIQLCIIGTRYNDFLSTVADTNNSVISVIKRKFNIAPETASVTFKEFFSENLFDEIKNDIKYNGEGCAAYGFEPAVLHWNGFNSLDGYSSIHSMKWQNEFREIIAPALDAEPEPWYKAYYDCWGGRMYLFGELSTDVSRNKIVEPAKLFINANAFKKYGGKYVFSRSKISNAEDIGLSFVKDYDSPDSLYHIWLYEAL